MTEDLLVTTAHVVCPVGEPMSVKLADGRELLGDVKKTDDWLDLALVHVLGAAARPLALGDAAQLAEGDRVTLIGAPGPRCFSANLLGARLVLEGGEKDASVVSLQ